MAEKTLLVAEPGWIRQASVCLTYTVDSANTAVTNGKKTITSGSLVKMSGAKIVAAAVGDACIGYLVHDVDVTDGDKAVSVLVDGVVDTTVLAPTAAIVGIKRI